MILKLVLIVSLISITFAFPPMRTVKNPFLIECQKDEMLCEDKRRCIPKTRICDGQQDCIDNSDETSCVNRCPGDNFRCNNGKCIEKSWVCDSMDDCGDGSDESNCLGLEHVPCSYGQYRCRDGPCIQYLKVCDDKRDCPQGDDESRCSMLKSRMANVTPQNNRNESQEANARGTNWQFNPHAPYSIKFNTQLSNSFRQAISSLNSNSTFNNPLVNKTTERELTGKREPMFFESYEINEGLKCSDDQFKCNDGLRCIPRAERCDGKLDCVDHSDEARCHTVCSVGQYMCNNGECIQNYWICDGRDDCGDGSDEEPVFDCRSRMCDSEYFRCSTGACINREWVCDGITDCKYNEDETRCRKYRRIYG
ncbi:sortilin-related receptor-like protein [Leptotrombidium deliense]|uniref:Sortilin-related receptor-like protein n=1 Tax=Leptotrombidium deliense TaxID=299467 RepID=A0A443SUE3_9ACAR|nr:sortilin-related receptor-like protein [Leptotrombidium deliense]